MSSRDQTATLLDQRLALSAYFDALLTPVELPAPAPSLSVVKTPVETVVETPPPVSVTVPVETAIETVVESASETVNEPPAVAERPAWADAPFQALMFTVAGIQLALPLVKLNGVIEMPDTLTPMPGHADWFLGVLPHQERNVKVVDTGHLILPANRRAAHRPGAATHIVLIDDMRWGLACDAIGEMVTLDPEQVRWRGQAGTRPWLAGTVIARLCALLDTEALAQQLLLGD